MRDNNANLVPGSINSVRTIWLLSDLDCMCVWSDSLCNVFGKSEILLNHPSFLCKLFNFNVNYTTFCPTTLALTDGCISAAGPACRLAN
jgi:hypothetical protein